MQIYGYLSSYFGMQNQDFLLYKLNTWVLSDQIPNHVDAIYIFAEPDGVLREAQIQRARSLQDRSTFIALCGGTGQGYVGYGAWAAELQQHGITDQKLLALPYAESLNTNTESLHLIAEAKQRAWDRLLIIAPPHQQLRAFMNVMLQRKLQEASVDIYNAASHLPSWRQEIVHYQGEVKNIAHSFIDSEIERIERYQSTDRLSSSEEALAHLLARRI